MAPGPDRVYVDGTVGLGGHAGALLEAGAGRVLGIDRDERALEIARERLAGFGDRVELVHADYRQLPDVLAGKGLGSVQGVLVDLGVSSLQLDDASRGFSFRQAGPLDMRMDRSSGETLAEKLTAVSEAELADVIYGFGEERKSRRVARAIVEARDRGALASSKGSTSLWKRRSACSFRKDALP